MKKIITQHLKKIAEEQGFRILYACETGSRGWGFASPDSDFDVRCIFAYPRERYLSVFPPEDHFSSIFEDSGEVLDLAGWELGKTLRHLSKSNATPFEWLQSPIIYGEIPGFREALMALGRDYFNARTLIHHYLGISQNSLNTGFVGDKINIKKYFYVLRPLLAAKWVAEKDSIPPMQFRPLLDQLEAGTPLREAIAQLWQEKEKAVEGALAAPHPKILKFIEEELTQLKSHTAKTNPNPEISPLNQFFQKWINY